LQVCIGNISDKEAVLHCIQSDRYTYLPNAALLFPQLLEPERIEMAPCNVSEFLRRTMRNTNAILTVIAPSVSQFLHQPVQNLTVVAQKEQL